MTTRNSAALPNVRKVTEGVFLIRSSSSNLIYTVSPDEQGFLTCSCPAGAIFHRSCKHLATVAAVIRREQDAAKRAVRPAAA